MKLTSKLVGYLGRVFNKDPVPQLALRLTYTGTSMTWTVADGVLTTVVVGGAGASLTVNLSLYTIAQLAFFLNSQTGYSVPFVASSSLGGLSARSLLDGSGNPATSNGDHLYSYTATLWAWFDAVASELQNCITQIGEMLKQMSIGTASGEWLDELGSYYNVPRLAGESDALYGPRIIASVGKPLGNNVAMEVAINAATAGLFAKVTDVALPTHFVAGGGGNSYGLFNVVYSIALDGTDTLGANTSRIAAVVESYRDAGMHMGSILVNGVLSDVYATSTIADTMGALNVNLGGIFESAALGYVLHDGTRRRDGSFVATGLPGVVSYNNSGETLTIIRVVSGVPQAPEQI